MADALGVPAGEIAFYERRSELPVDIDIITNSGALRPIDEELIALTGPRGVVSVMYEAWELRPEDIDLAACRRHGVPVAGVNEDWDELAIFRSCGALAVKLCHEAGLEIAGNTLVLLADAHYGPVIEQALAALHAEVHWVAAEAVDPGLLQRADGVIVADYYAEAPVVGGSGALSIDSFLEAGSSPCVVQVVGPSAVGELVAAGFSVHPPVPTRPRQMAATLSHLGPRPVTYLLAAGLKVGELLWRQRADGPDADRFAGLVQPVRAAG